MSLRSQQAEGELATESNRDARLQGEIVSLLEGSSYYGLRQLNCRVHDGVVELQGTVPTFFLKQVAQSMVSSLPGSQGIRNLVEVS